MYEVSVRTVPARSLLSLLRYVRQDEFPAVARDFTGRFADGSVPRLPGTGGAPFIVYHGEVSEDSDGPVEWCRPVPDEAGVMLAAAPARPALSRVVPRRGRYPAGYGRVLAGKARGLGRGRGGRVSRPAGRASRARDRSR